MANRKKRTPEKDDKFFLALSQGATVGDACRGACYGRSATYEWREADPEFAARWQDAIKDAVERMEAEADRRAVEGTQRPVFYKGEECGAIREFSDTLLIFRLKALRPDKYRERFEHTGKDGDPLIPAAEFDLTKTALALLNLLTGLRAARGEATAAETAPGPYGVGPADFRASIASAAGS